MYRSACLLTLLSLTIGACGSSSDDETGDTNNTPATNTMGSISLTPGDSDSMPTTAGETTAGSVSDTMDAETTMTPTGGSTTFDPNDCGEAQIMIPIVTPNVMLVLDKSGSMVKPPNAATMDPGGFWDHDNDDPDGDGLLDDGVTPATAQQTRWRSLYATVDFIVTTFDASMNLGMNLFPSTDAIAEYDESACPVNSTVEVPVAPMNASNILAAMPSADVGDKPPGEFIAGGTPATKGVEAALAELMSIDTTQPKFMLLITDGAANCPAGAEDQALFEVYDDGLPAVVSEANSLGIPTYVIGIGIKNVTSGTTPDGNPDSTNTFDKLNELANMGGVPQAGDVAFYDTQNQLQLQAALESISMQILSCTIALDPVPVYPDYVEVTVNGMEYGKDQVADCAAEDGWQFTNAEKTEIELCGAACESFQMTGALDAQYRCPNSG
jgi:hypothetical protein